MLATSNATTNEFDLRSIFDDLLFIPTVDSLAEEGGYSTRGYVLLRGDRALLIDVIADYHLPAITRLRDDGRRPVGVVLTHHHLLGQSSAPSRFERELGVSLFLHPLDASEAPSAEGGPRFADPVGAALLADFGLEASLFPGHTPGHVLLEWSSHGGVVFAGDCAMGATWAQHEAGMKVLCRPPFSFNNDDGALRRAWEGWGGRVASILPLHGQGILGDPGAVTAALAVLREDEPTPEFGHE